MKKIKYILISIVTMLVATGVVYAVSTLNSSEVSYDNTSSNLTSTNVQGVLDEIYTNISSGDCPDGYKCEERKSTPEVGDYVKMTPTSTSYTTDTSKTGYDSTQTINPSELNLWRVIKVNNDGTIEMVSEYASSVSVYFKGQTGYQNFVGYLNTLASQYTNSKYTIGSRYMGYNGQTEYITDTTALTSTTAPWTSSTGSSTTESQGGGDTLYTTDTNLVKNAVGTLATNKVGTTSASYYWLASRYYYTSSSKYWKFEVRRVFTDGQNYSSALYSYDSGFNSYSYSNALRPIVILKSGITYASALGTSDDPFVLD